MTHCRELEDFLDAYAERAGGMAGAVAQTILALAGAAREIADLLAAGPLIGNLAAVHGPSADGDGQKELDLRANALVLAALRDAPVAVVGSEEVDAPLMLRAGAPLAVAIDPLDGSSNIDTNAPVGTIFSILPMTADAADPCAAFSQSGERQLAGGFFIYGAQTTLVMSVRQGVQVFTLDRKRNVFVLTRNEVRLQPATREFAINASNHRHWHEPVRLYVHDCLQGAEGPRAKDFNMRWIASMVAEAYRILVRGGVYLYPGDDRKGYWQGRLRLAYEANPIALLMEEAGGAATDGRTRILDLKPDSLHQRTPLVFGSRDEVERVRRYHEAPAAIAARSPLFGHRSLFRV